MRKRLKDYFHRVEMKILRVIGSGKGSSWAVKKDYDEGAVFAAFDDEELQKAAKEIIENAITLGAVEIAGKDLSGAAALEILEEKLIKITDTNKTSRTVVVDKIRDVLNESLSAGDGAQATARKLRESLKDAMNINRNRAETIARTEIGGSFNQAGYKAAQENGAVGTRWISARDGNERESHAEYDGKTILNGDLFGGVIAYPHDPGGPAGEVINCRCMHEPIYAEDLQ
jgi:SPP1 gp7 family putative phage head morphogenesis protein